MRVVLVGTFVLTALTNVLAQDVIEPPNFNVSAALENLGVNLTALPALESLATRSSFSGCSIACGSLKVLFGSDELYSEDTQAFTSFRQSYWSQQQAQVEPYCVFEPAEQAKLSALVLISRLTQCPFAIKSGGHAAFGGASSIEGGITVSLAKFNQITLSSDQQSVTVGPGNRWLAVYQSLQAQNLVVVGGRVSAIGVGGLTLGGGISWFSNLYGWACDNVLEYNIITATGIPLTVNQELFPDLYWSLRGGGSNYGIVTSMKLRTLPLPGGMMWGGSRISLNATNDASIQAFVNLGTTGAQKDPNSTQILSFTYYQGTPLTSAALIYTAPVADAPVFGEYLAIPAISDTTSIRTLANLTGEFAAANPDGLREQYWTATYKLTVAMTKFVQDVFYEELSAIVDAEGLIPAATLQVITVSQMKAMKTMGGNPLGLDPNNGALLLLNMNVMWMNPADDQRITTFNKNIIDRTIAYAKENGLDEDYLYMNYASQYQDVLYSYGNKNRKKMAKIARKYDPTGVFQDLVPGGFKFGGSPAQLSGTSN